MQVQLVDALCCLKSMHLQPVDAFAITKSTLKHTVETNCLFASCGPGDADDTPMKLSTCSLMLQHLWCGRVFACQQGAPLSVVDPMKPFLSSRLQFGGGVLVLLFSWFAVFFNFSVIL